MKFVSELPEDGRRHYAKPDLDALRERPGQWAEIARFPISEKTKAYGRGSYLARNNDDIIYTTRTVGEEIVLFIRAVAS